MLTFRLTVPAPCGGALIGPGGAIIKRIATESSCNVRVGDNLDPFHTKERFVILTSSSIDCIVAVRSLITLSLLFFPLVRTLFE